jgi:hypothetical protein
MNAVSVGTVAFALWLALLSPAWAFSSSQEIVEGIPLRSFSLFRKVDATLYRGIPKWTVEVSCLGAEVAPQMPTSNDQQLVVRTSCTLLPLTPQLSASIELSVRDPSGSLVFHKIQGVNLLSGEADPAGDLAHPLRTPTYHDSARGISIAYGFFSPPPSTEGDPLATNFQVYLYLTEDQSSWMATVPTLHDQPFFSWPLPGVHDAGMYGSTVFAESSVAKNLAFTQKESPYALMRSGARFFDVRPGHSLESLIFGTSLLTHQHSIVDGAPLPDFLDSVIRFLLDHPSEIVVLNLNDSGVPQWMLPNLQKDPGLISWIEAALKPYAASGLSYTAALSDTQLTYNELIARNTRIFYLYNALNNAHTNDSYWAPQDSYEDLPSIPNALVWAVEQCQAAVKPNTLLQLQGTPTELPGVIIEGVFSRWFNQSHLIGSKSWLDARTYPMIAGLLTLCPATASSGLRVLINDFYDPALSDLVVRSIE